MTSPTLYWYNYRTEKHEARQKAPADFSDYLPQIPAALGLYRAYQKVGDSPLAAFIKVGERMTSTSPKEKEQ